MFNRHNALLKVIGLSLGLGLSAPASAEELRLAIGMAGDNELVHGMEAFAANIEDRTGGAYTGKVFQKSLLSFAESMTGVRDGIADVAYVVPAYHRAEFPNSNLVVDMATITTDPMVMAAAATEFMLECAACLKEYGNQNQVFMGYSAIGPYYLQSKDKVLSLDDFKGKKLRGFGSFGRWVEAMGGTSVSLPAGEIYEAISQGHLDGNTHTVDVLKSLSLGEVVNYLMVAPIGIYSGNSMFNLNKDLWNELTNEQKRQFLLAAGDAHAATTVKYLAANVAFLDDPASVGVELVTPNDDVIEATEHFLKTDLDTVAEINSSKYNIADAAEQIQTMAALVQKWETLLAGIDSSDPDAVGELYNAEIYSKIDLASLTQ